jgi:hypothetical protein
MGYAFSAQVFPPSKISLSISKDEIFQADRIVSALNQTTINNRAKPNLIESFVSTPGVGEPLT